MKRNEGRAQDELVVEPLGLRVELGEERVHARGLGDDEAYAVRDARRAREGAQIEPDDVRVHPPERRAAHVRGGGGGRGRVCRV